MYQAWIHGFGSESTRSQSGRYRHQAWNAVFKARMHWLGSEHPVKGLRLIPTSSPLTRCPGFQSVSALLVSVTHEFDSESALCQTLATRFRSWTP